MKQGGKEMDNRVWDAPITLSIKTWNLLIQCNGDTGENEGADDVIHRLAKEHLERRNLIPEPTGEKCPKCGSDMPPENSGWRHECDAGLCMEKKEGHIA